MTFSVCWRGCRLEMGFSCFALLAFTCLFLGRSSGVLFLIAAALHELSHIAVLILFGAPPALVRFTALGCRMVPNREKVLSYGRMAAVSLAGPGMNLLLAGGMAIFGLEEHPFCTANLVLGILHSLPVEPLDGGLAFRGLLQLRLSQERAAKCSFVVSLGILLPMAVLGFLILLRTRYNFTLLAMSLYLMLYLVLKRDFLS